MSNSNFCTSIICFQFPHQGTYKKKHRNIFEIPALLSCNKGNSE